MVTVPNPVTIMVVEPVLTSPTTRSHGVLTMDTLDVDHGRLEYTIDDPEGECRAIAVVCHPHPEHGGSIHNKVVYHTAKELSDHGARVLRFNFRGVGASSGEYDGGTGERQDARDAVAFLQESHPDVPLVLGGFSFGSMVSLSLIDELGAVAGIGVGIPLTLYDYSHLLDLDVPLLVVQGEHDPFGTYDDVRTFFGEHVTNVEVHGVDGAEHFLKDRYSILRSLIRDFLRAHAEWAKVEG